MNNQKKYNKILKENYIWFEKENLKDPRDIIRRRYVLKFIKKFQEEKKQKNLNLLDFGCGDGAFAARLTNLNNDVIGLDISNEVINLAKKKFGNYKNLKFYCLDINKKINKKFNKRFDIILLMDVLEHLRDPDLVLKVVYCMLKNDGILIISVPHNPKYWNKLDELTGHCRRYTIQSLNRVLDRNKFEIWKYYIIGFPFNLLFMFLQAALSKEGAYIPKSRKTKKIYKLIYPFLYFVLNLDMLLNFTKKGYEIIAKIKKAPLYHQFR